MSNPNDLFSALRKMAEQSAKMAEQANKQLVQSLKEFGPTLERAAEQTKQAAEQLGSEAQKAWNEAVANAQAEFEQFQKNPSMSPPLDEIGSRMAMFGAPAAIFAVAASIAGSMGLAGGAIITAALAILGGPIGMIGGLALLGIAGIITDAVLKHGLDNVLLSTYQARIKQGDSRQAIASEIDLLWISNELKLKLKQQLGLLS